jgi:hypothetical protein
MLGLVPNWLWWAQSKESERSRPNRTAVKICSRLLRVLRFSQSTTVKQQANSTIRAEALDQFWAARQYQARLLEDKEVVGVHATWGGVQRRARGVRLATG